MASMKHIVVLTGAGISAESGLATFRDSNGLWEGHRVEDVATPEAWRRDPAKVLTFYNERRRAARNAEPNAGHIALRELESKFRVSIITQNVDGLHEKAGSSFVVHLHGELDKAQSTADESLLYRLNGKDIRLGDRCEKGSQLRPFIVWFGEAVPKMEEAIAIASTADIFLIVGTSLAVYPAAGLLHYAPRGSEVVLVDPKCEALSLPMSVRKIAQKASLGVPMLAEELLRG